MTWTWAKATWPAHAELLTEAHIAGLTLSEALLAVAVANAERQAALSSVVADLARRLDELLAAYPQHKGQS